MNEKEEELLKLSEELSPITKRLVEYVDNICKLERQKAKLDKELKQNLLLMTADCQTYLKRLK